MNYEYSMCFFVTRLHITDTKFPGDRINMCIVIASIFFHKRYFYKSKKNWKSSYGFWNINKFIQNFEK